MRIDLRPSVFQQPNYSQHFLRPLIQPFAQPYLNHPVFRPFVQPFLKHPFVRKFVQPFTQPPTRRPFNPTTTTNPTTFDTATKRYWDGKDPTLRANDPYAANLNVRSFDERQATNNLTREETLSGMTTMPTARSLFPTRSTAPPGNSMVAREKWHDVPCSHGAMCPISPLKRMGHAQRAKCHLAYRTPSAPP